MTVLRNGGRPAKGDPEAFGAVHAVRLQSRSLRAGDSSVAAASAGTRMREMCTMDVREDQQAQLPRCTLPVLVVGVAELATAIASLVVPTAVVVDAAGQADLPVTLLARLVRLRRVLRTAGGELVLVADHAVADALTRTGLLFTLPFYETVPEAVASLNATAKS